MGHYNTPPGANQWTVRPVEIFGKRFSYPSAIIVRLLPALLFSYPKNTLPNWIIKGNQNQTTGWI